MTEQDKVRAQQETTRVLAERNKDLEQEVVELHRLCEQQVSDCLTDKAGLLMRGQKTAGLICPEIEHRIINGVENRHPYDLIIEGALIRKYFSSGNNLNPNKIPTDDALEAWVVLYDIEFQYDSGCDTYHFTKCKLKNPLISQSHNIACTQFV